MIDISLVGHTSGYFRRCSLIVGEKFGDKCAISMAIEKHDDKTRKREKERRSTIMWHVKAIRLLHFSHASTKLLDQSLW